MNRRKTTGRNLPPRMLARTRTFKNGSVWVGYYYNSLESGKRKEIPLGTDLTEAKRKWAELECKPVPVEAGTMEVVFARYELEILPTKAPRTQIDNLDQLARLRSVFSSAPVGAVTPQHIARYRDARMTKARTLQDGTVIPAKRATVAANRELALFSHVWNKAREWGYTAKTNPCAGVSKNKETPRDFYADDEVWQAVRSVAVQELQDAMDLAYLTGQRPADVLKMTMQSVTDESLSVRQGKTAKMLQIMLDTDGRRNELGEVLDRIKARKVRGLHLLMTASGLPLNRHTLRVRFEAARAAAAALARSAGNAPLAERIELFQFRDARPKAASEIQSLTAASELLGHSKEQITKTVYRRVGQKVKPTR